MEQLSDTQYPLKYTWGDTRTIIDNVFPTNPIIPTIENRTPSTNL